METNKPRYFIGIDGGGSKTALCAACTEENGLRYAKTSGSSWREHGIAQVAGNLKEAVNGLMGNEAGQIAGIAMGLPCVGESDEGDVLLEKAVRGAFPQIPVYIGNDVEVGWAGSLALGPGIHLVAGTGTIAFGKDALGHTMRCGGWSDFFGDEGSGYWISRRAMEYFSKQADGRMPRDELYAMFYRELGLKNDLGFIDIMHRDYIDLRKNVASLQILVEKAALAGSAAARAIYKDSVKELCLLVTAVRRQLDLKDMPWIVSYSGGLFRSKDLVLGPFRETLEKEGAKIVPPCFEPAEGALLLAYQRFCPEGLENAKNLIRSGSRFAVQ